VVDRARAQQSKRWRFVALRYVVVVESAFGGDGSGFVVRAGVSASGHHGAALAGGFGNWWLAVPQGGGGFA